MKIITSVQNCALIRLHPEVMAKKIQTELNCIFCRSYKNVG